jgi:type I restriction enzyme S subunit
MSELPQGWETCELKVCADVLDNLRVPVNSKERAKRLGNIPYFGATGQVGWINDFLFDEEILLIGEDGAPFFDKSKPIAYIVHGKSWVNNHAHVLRARPEITSNLFLKWFLDSFDFNSYVNGTTRLKLTQGSMNQIPIPLPPLNEQRRIVAKLEEVLAKVDASQKRLARIPVILKRFRQAVLAAACSGRLTADWREKNNDCVGAKQGSSASPAFGGDTGKGKAGEMLALPLQNLGDDDLPEGWNSTTLGEITSLVTSGSRGWAQYYSDSGSVFIRAQNINADFLDLSDIAYVTLPKGAEGQRTKVQKNDLLVTITGANVTKSACVRDDINDAFVSQHVALVRLNDVRQSAFVFLCIISPNHGRSQLLEAAYGQGKPGLNLSNIRDVSIPLPPLPEQQEIVRRVESYFTLADQLEARYQKAKVHIDKLTQSLLAKAFRGELVPQDPNDEPAPALLERIRTQGDVSIPPKKKKVL